MTILVIDIRVLIALAVLLLFGLTYGVAALLDWWSARRRRRERGDR